MGGFETTSKCAGCGEQLELLSNHIVLTHKVRKMAFVTVAPNPDDFDPEAEKDVEAEEENQTVLGARTGVGEELLFHDFNCVADYFGKDTLRKKKAQLKLNRDSTDPYSEGGEE